MKILTFDIEEWFHILDNDSTKTECEWSKFPERIQKNTDRILDILENTSTSATFFCLGWIAEKYPTIIRKIAEKYEIGSHTNMHQLVYEQRPHEFKNDVERSIKTLQDITGQPIRYFRAPGFSITEKTKWAFEILVELGVEIDSSVFPVKRAHGGFPSYEISTPSLIEYNGIKLKELPISYKTIFGKEIIYSGGGYFRLFPYFFIKKWTGESEYLMSYLHPRDFDSEQPMIKDLALARKFKSYVGLRGAERKFYKWIKDFEFVDIKTADLAINWDLVPIRKINIL